MPPENKEPRAVRPPYKKPADKFMLLSPKEAQEAHEERKKERAQKVDAAAIDMSKVVYPALKEAYKPHSSVTVDLIKFDQTNPVHQDAVKLLVTGYKGVGWAIVKSENASSHNGFRVTFQL